MRICVFCGSSPGTHVFYREYAANFGRLLAARGIGLVYGGAQVGTMGVLANAVLDAGGQVIGVIPQAMMDREIAHPGLTELHVVSSMHERKALMAEHSDAFVALPGGFGTYEEFCEAVTWVQLGIQHKPCILANLDGFYDPLVAQFARGHDAGFISEANSEIVRVVASLDELLTVIQGTP